MSFMHEIKRLLGVATTDQQNKNQEDLLISLLIMAWMVEARDPYTGGHLWRVSQFSQLLARDAKLAPEVVSRITLGAFLHDLGKVSVPDHVLGKPGKLTDAEYAIIRTHPEVGWRMLSSHPLAALAEEAIRAHHETPDGKGYPRGLSGDDISVDARIVGLCDAFDAMTSTRPYRQGMAIEKALDIIGSNLGTQFDRALGERFVAMGRRGELDHIVGHSDAGIPLQLCAMCGPIVAVPRALAGGAHVYCPHCTGEFVTSGAPGALRLTPTGKTGNPEVMAPKVDSDVINDVVRASAQALLAQ